MHSPKLFLIILDGWGQTINKDGNAIFSAKKPTYEKAWKYYPHTILHAFGNNVGLPWGATGSSEVGHKSIGSGRKVIQEYSLIDEKIATQEFFLNQKIINFWLNINFGGLSC